MSEDDLMFADEDAFLPSDDTAEDAGKKKKFWKLLIVDDEPEVHTTTKLVLGDFEFEGAGLVFLSAYTGKQALELMREHDDVALVLLDVVMETDHAGLDCARAIRNELNNHLVRIVLRTGQPGQAPEQKVIVEYDINDYKNKSEITSQRLFTTVYTAVRSYRDMVSIDKQRLGLRYIIEASGDFFKEQSISKLAKGVLTQFEALFRLQDSLFISGTGFAAALDCHGNKGTWEFITATGKYTECLSAAECGRMEGKVVSRMQQVAENKTSMFFDGDYVGYFPTQKNRHHIIYLEDCGRHAWDEIQDLLQVFANNVGIAFDNAYLNQEILDTQTEVVLRLGEVVESRSKETAYHVVRVAEYSYLLARGCGLDEKESRIIKLASPMHDVGKIAIPDRVLLKPGRLTPEEHDVIKTHTDIGYKILGGSGRTLLKEAAIIAYTHHERWDKKGYPRGLAGEDIPLSGRITALVDIFDALGSDRVYKKAWPLDRVFDYILQEKGRIFDPRLVDIFLEHKTEVLKIRERYRDKSRERA